MSDSESGAATLIVAGVLVVGVVLALLVADVAGIAATRARVVTAADAAALAAAPATFADFGMGEDPRVAASRAAAANGATLVACRCSRDTSWTLRRVLVTAVAEVDLVLLGSHRLSASAAAEFAPVLLGVP